MASKYERLAQLLRDELPRLRAAGTARMPSEAEIVQQYGVSRQTVRHALTLLEADGLIEKRRGSGTYLKEGEGVHSTQIAVVASYVNDYIFPNLLRDVQAVLANENYSVAVYATGNSVFEERKLLQRLLREPVAGILIEGVKTALPNPNLDLYEQLRRNTPMVFLHGVYSDLADAVCIGDDNVGGGYQLTRHLLEQGHTQIAGIFKSDDIQGLRRYQGCMAALRDADLLQPDSHFHWYTTDDRWRLVEQRDPELLQRFLQQVSRDCTAVVCYNDEIAFYLIKELLRMGRRVPEDMAVVSFDNSYYSELSTIPITSLGHASHAVGRTAASGLLDMLRGQPCRSRRLPWELYRRESG